MLGEAEVLRFVGFGNRKTDPNPEQIQKIGDHTLLPKRTAGGKKNQDERFGGWR